MSINKASNRSAYRGQHKGLRHLRYADGNDPSIRDRPVDLLSVACPSCEAPKGEPCLSSTGRVTHHAGRRRLAIRAEPDYSMKDIQYAQDLGGWTRKRVRELVRATLVDLSEEFEISYTRMRRWETGDYAIQGPAGAAYGVWLREAYSHVEAQIQHEQRLRGHRV